MSMDTTAISSGRSGLVIGLATLACLSTACSHPPSTAVGETNPTPHKRYSLEAEIRDSPGPIDRVTADATYEVENTSCVPLTPVSGVRKIPRHVIALPLTRDRDGYKAEFFADGMVDGDYYGQGVCHWKLILVGFRAIRKARQFDAVIRPFGEHAQGKSTTFFADSSYDRASEGQIDTGLYDQSRFKHPEQTFEIILTAREANNE